MRDYAFDELPAAERPAMEEHIALCEDCALELDQLRVTTAALRTLPDREIPQRIAFVSDKVFAPSGVSRWFGGFWNSAARLGFASACVLAGALLVSAYHRPLEIRTVVSSQPPAQQAPAQDVSKQMDEAVARAVSQVRAEDAKATQAVLAAVNLKHQQEHRELMIAMQENFEFLQKHFNTNTLLASAESPLSGAGQ